MLRMLAATGGLFVHLHAWSFMPMIITGLAARWEGHSCGYHSLVTGWNYVPSVLALTCASVPSVLALICASVLILMNTHTKDVGRSFLCEECRTRDLGSSLPLSGSLSKALPSR
jgi:hypothetical protein